MEFGFSKEEEAFRQEVRAFLAGVATPEVVAEADSGQGWGPHTWKFVQALGSRQWLTPTWPKEYGGLALPPMYRFIIHEEIDFTGALKPEALIVGPISPVRPSSPTDRTSRRRSSCPGSPGEKSSSP